VRPKIFNVRFERWLHYFYPLTDPVSAQPANHIRCSSNIAIADHFPSKTFSTLSCYGTMAILLCGQKSVNPLPDRTSLTKREPGKFAYQHVGAHARSNMIMNSVRTNISMIVSRALFAESCCLCWCYPLMHALANLLFTRDMAFYL